MRIGELAGISGVAASTLRFYESNGLLPAPRRAGNGYRDYPEDTLERIGMIRLAQSLGFNLEQIRKVLSSRGTDGSHELIMQGLQGRLEEIEQLQAKLAEQRAGVLDMLERLQGSSGTGTCVPLATALSTLHPARAQGG